MRKITLAQVEDLERRATQALQALAGGFDLDAWKAGTEDTSAIDPAWLAIRRGRLAEADALEDD